MPYKKPAPPYFGTAFYEDDEGQRGFTENYWISVSTGESHSQALDRLDQIALARMNLTTSEMVLKAIRVSDAAVKGDTLVKKYTTAEGAGTFNPDGQGNLPMDDCLLMRMQGLNVLIHTSKPLHGLPRVLQSVDDAELFVSDANWDAAWDAYTALLVDFTWLVQQVPSRPDPGDPVTFNVTSVDNVMRTDQIRDHRIGRPFSLRRGRYAPR